MALTLPPLSYPYDALQPYMSRETLEYHHDKHHKAYVDTANNLLKDSPLADKPLEVIITESHGKNAPLFNNAAQAWNHAHFWKWLKPNGGGKIPGALEKALIDSFGSIDAAKQQFVQAGMTQFGSGWAWLTVKDGKIAVLKTANGENPLIFGSTAILGVDVWEHSYYIDYRNRRLDYLNAVFDHLVNWDYVSELYAGAVK
jgi:superoxide dismutase, Fe-Mn family